MRGAGGSPGGLGSFGLGLLLFGGGIWLLLDAIHVRSAHGWLGRYTGGSMLITLAPLALGILLLFINSRNKFAWLLAVAGLAIVLLEAISGLRLDMRMKLWQLLILLVAVIGGLGLMIRSFRDGGKRA